ncbi:hypothetical protein [Roseibium sp.]|uniref:hypothetical protein n=1 Tax=Roseibium sp. TaxID=1936156 RepID=UPI003A9698CD
MKRLRVLQFLGLFVVPLGGCALGPDVTLLDVVSKPNASASTSVAEASSASTAVIASGDDVDTPLALASRDEGQTDPGSKVLSSSGASSVSLRPGAVVTSAEAQKEATIAYLKALGLANGTRGVSQQSLSVDALRRLAASERADALADIEAGSLATD